ncbi:MAG: hypothetical protein IAE78_26785 [Myxococcus sp.]|nr:hypothetical protein [Myxococcus sp.]
MRATPITEKDLLGLRGLRIAARGRLLAQQPQTVFEALCIRDVARATTRELLKRGVLIDPEGVQRRSLTDDELALKMRTKAQDRGG